MRRYSHDLTYCTHAVCLGVTFADIFSSKLVLWEFILNFYYSCGLPVCESSCAGKYRSVQSSVFCVYTLSVLLRFVIQDQEWLTALYREGQCWDSGEWRRFRGYFWECFHGVKLTLLHCGVTPVPASLVAQKHSDVAHQFLGECVKCQKATCFMPSS